MQLLLSVTWDNKSVDLLYVQWFTAKEDEWNWDLNLRPLEWHRYGGVHMTSNELDVDGRSVVSIVLYSPTKYLD